MSSRADYLDERYAQRTIAKWRVLRILTSCGRMEIYVENIIVTA